MAEATIRLCKHVVANHFGSTVEAVSTALVKLGRLPLPMIVKSTGLSPKRVREALVVLILHGLVTHANATEANGRIITHYSARQREILRRTRIGLYMKLAKDNLDECVRAALGFDIVKTTLLSGALTAKQLRQKMGITGRQKQRSEKFQRALMELVRERYLTALTPKDTITEVDKILREEIEAKKSEKFPLSDKQMQEIRRSITARRYEEYNNNVIVGMKRKVVSESKSEHDLMMGFDDGPSKVHIGGDSQDEVEEDVYFRVNFDRLDVLLRNQQIAAYIKTKINTGASLVMGHILKLTEAKTKSCLEHTSSPITANQIVHSIPKDLPLSETMVLDADGPAGRESRLVEYAHAYIELIHSDNSGILVKRDERGSGEYVVDFEHAFQTLRDKQVDMFVQEKLGSVCARIMRVLRKMGKLDENQIAQLSMISVGMCRSCLHEMFGLGLIDLHEVPRSADKAPKRVIYLWHVDYNKQLQAMLNLAYT
ncbi:RNA polymerase III subunit C82, partial [Spiromyces aspiralis]